MPRSAKVPARIVQEGNRIKVSFEGYDFGSITFNEDTGASGNKAYGKLLESEPRTAARHPRLLRPVVLAAVLGAAVLLSSCAAGPNPAVGTGGDSPGFLTGLWHGIIVFFTFVISLFTDDVSVYEVANDGNWYDFGFFLGLMISLGGSGAGARRRKKRR